jgi:hypothetical protein
MIIEIEKPSSTTWKILQTQNMGDRCRLVKEKN